MKKLLFFLAALAAFAIPATAQSPFSKVGGIYDSTQYNKWGAFIAVGNTATGSQTVTVCPAFVTLPDGRQMTPFSTSIPLTFDPAGASAETVTPSAVSLVSVPPGLPNNSQGQCAAVTATFSNTHGASFNLSQVISGDQGIQEAVNDASSQGGGMVYWQADGGTVALSTSGATTTVCTTCIPANALVLGVVARVNTTITGCSGGWELGDGTTATRFTAANATLTSGTVSAADLQTTSGIASTTTGMLAAAAKSIVNTCVTSNAGAGAIHVRAFGYILATPSN